MPVLVNLVYLVLLIAAAPWLLYAAWRHGKYREGFGEKLMGRVPIREGDRPCIWFHAVSVGEVNLLKTLLDRAEEEFPGWDFVISTTTKTGYELAKKRYAYAVFYAPLDFSWAVQESVRRLRPDILVLAELELWPNLIGAAKRGGCRVAILNARLSEISFRRYRWIRPIIANVLRRVDLIAAQSDEYADRFQHLGAFADRVHVTGSVKFDGVQTDRGNPATRRLRKLAGIGDGDIVFLAGSTQSPEEQIALQTFKDLQERYSRLKLILAPRHPTRCSEIQVLLDRCGLRWQRRTDLDNGVFDPRARILLVDTIGELGAWWGTAHVAFVGGSLGNRGGQNMIEPSAYGAAVAFGPNTRNFRDIVTMLLSHEAAVVVRDGSELTAFVRRCLEQSDWATQLGQRARKLVGSQQGASDRTIALLGTLIKKGPDSGRVAA